MLACRGHRAQNQLQGGPDEKVRTRWNGRSAGAYLGGSDVGAGPVRAAETTPRASEVTAGFGVAQECKYLRKCALPATV